MQTSAKYLLFLLLFFPLVSPAQISPEQIVRYKVNSVERSNPIASADIYVISAPYGKPVLSANTLKELRGRQVVSVELVYTRFRRSENFDQRKLNVQRLQNLKKIWPKIFAGNAVDWIITEQTGATDYNTGQGYFHGFVVTTRKAEFTQKDRDIELEELKKSMEEDKSASALKTIGDKSFRERNTNPTYDKSTVEFYNIGAEFTDDPCDLVEDAEAHVRFPKEALVRKVSGRVQAQFTVNKFGDVQDVKIIESLGFGCDDAVREYLRTMPKWKPARNKQNAVSSYVTLSFWFVQNMDYMPSSEMPCDLIVIVPEGTGIPDLAQSRNNVVSEIFSRNNTWNHVAVVCDATGSMGPYMGDLMKWFRLNVSRIKHFTFFNDGDMKSDGQKAIGATGGIYHSPAASYDAVEKEMYTAMRNGFGGDLPENDVEALLEAEKNAPFAERLIWIADNYATPRDLSLLPKLTKPVSIIICSNQNQVSVDFLNIARKIKASLHTLTTDLPDLSGLRDGEKIKIDDREYQLVGEKFVRIY